MIYYIRHFVIYFILSHFEVFVNCKTRLYEICFERIDLMSTSSIFPQRLKELRLKKGFTQSELGEKVGVKQNTFTNWENGKREPNFEKLLLLAKYLETTTDNLLGRSILSIDTVPLPITSFDFSQIENIPLEQYPNLKQAIVLEYMRNGTRSTQLLQEITEKYHLNKQQIKLLKEIIEDTKSAFIDEF